MIMIFILSLLPLVCKSMICGKGQRPKVLFVLLLLKLELYAVPHFLGILFQLGH